MRQSRFSLQTGLPAVLLLVVLVLFVAGYLDSVYHNVAALKERAQAQMLQDAERIASLSQRELVVHPESVAADIGILSTQHQVAALAVINARGEVAIANRIAWQGRPAAGLIDGFSADRFAQATAGRLPDIDISPDGSRMSVLLSFVEDSGRDRLRPLTRGVVFLEYDLSYDYAMLRWLARQRAFSLAPAALLFVILLTFGLRFLVIRPLANIERASVDLAERHSFDKPLNENGPREIAHLAKWFNTMAQRLLQTQGDLRASQSRFSSILDAAMDAIVTVDDRHRITVINAAALKMFGCTEAQALGQPIDIFIPERFRSGHEEHMQRFANTGASLRAHGGHRAVVACRRLGGEEFPAEASISQVKIDGERLMTVILRDVTERLQAQDQLQQMHSQLEAQVEQRTATLQATMEALADQQKVLQAAHAEQQAIFDTVTVGIVLIRGRTVVRCNRMLEVLFGYAPGEMEGLDIRHWFADDSFHAVLQEAQVELSERKFLRREQELVRKSGARFWARMSFVPLSEDGEEGITLGVLEDMTLQHQAQEAILQAKREAEDASRAKSSFLANMSHEIRTPMNAIIGMSYLVLKTDLTPRQREQINKIQASSQHLLGIINDILDYSKIEAGKLELEQVDFTLDTVLEHVSTLIGGKAAAKGLELILDVDPAVPMHLVGDPLRFEQILTNYANNAVKFTAQGSITIQMRVQQRDGDQLLLYGAVQDTGVGLSSAQVDQLFQSFQQGDSSTTREFGGTGLGLAICKQLANLMQGEVGVESELGVGSTFWFTAKVQAGRAESQSDNNAAGPLHDASVGRSMLGNGAVQGAEALDADTGVYAPGPQVRPHGANAHPLKAIQGARVLLVEDNELNREVATELLTGEGLLVDTAVDGQQALGMVQSWAYALVLMDMQMPVMDGLTATRKIREIEHLRSLPIIAMTANAMDADRQACLDAGMNDHLGKPIEPDALFATLLRWIPAGAISQVSGRAAFRSQPLGPSVAIKPGASSASAAPHAGDVDLPALEGLDVNAGLRRVMGKKQFYLSLLRKFVDRQADVCDRLSAQLQQNNWADAQRTAHTLKGLAGSIGIASVQQAAMELEGSISRQQDPSTVSAHLEALRQTLTPYLDGLRAQLGVASAPATSVPADHARAMEVCKQLAVLLSEDDLEAGDLISANEAVLRQALGPSFEGIDAAVRRFDCDAALQSLREAAVPLGYDLGTPGNA